MVSYVVYMRNLVSKLLIFLVVSNFFDDVFEDHCLLTLTTVKCPVVDVLGVEKSNELLTHVLSALFVCIHYL